MRYFCIFLLLQVVSATVASDPPTCPDGFVLFANGQKCIKLFEFLKYNDAVQKCLQIPNGNIISIHDDTQNQALLNLITSLHSVSPIWLGLFCPTTSSESCSWDDGSGTTRNYNRFSNGAPNTGSGNNVYMLVTGDAAGKWVSADGNMAYMNFVCEVPSSAIPANQACTPSTPSTFFFAYSNDLDPSEILEIWGYFDKYGWFEPRMTSFANVRFDLRQQEDIQYHSVVSDVMNSVASNLPDPALGFTDASSGSNILSIIQTFVNNTQVPVCGSAMLILLKRYPNEKSIDEVVGLLRQHHIYIFVVSHEIPSGGLYSDTMYNIATKTNGMCVFGMDKNYVYAATNGGSLYSNFLYYSANVAVSKNTSTILPMMRRITDYSSRFYMTLQDHGPLNSFSSLHLSWQDQNLEHNGNEYSNVTKYSQYWGNGTFYDIYNMPATVGLWSLNLVYQATGPSNQILQFRAFGFSESSVTSWLPYD